MPRPIKDGLDYFPLDTALFTQDKRIKTLLRKFGADGITFLIALWCDIYGGTGYYVVADEDYLIEMSHDTGINLNTIRQIMAYLLDRSLFDNTLFQSVKVLTAPGIQRRFELAVKERVRKRRAPVIVDADYWLLPEEEEETVTFKEDGKARCIKVIYKKVFPRNNSINPRKNEVIPRNKCTKESKGKERKEKESKAGGEEPTRSPFGYYQNIMLSETEYTALVNEFGVDTVKNYIERIGSHIMINHAYYGNHEATIRKWILEDEEKAAGGRKTDKHAAKPNRFHNFDQVGYDYDAIVHELNASERTGG